MMADTNHDPDPGGDERGGGGDAAPNSRKRKRFPPGYRFNPRGDELINYYLKRKLNNLPIPFNIFNDVKLYDHNPRDLVEKYKTWGEESEDKLYFFTPRERKYRNGCRPNRAAGNGYWKATGVDKKIMHNNREVGVRKTLVFYEGKPGKGTVTDWTMHEYVPCDDTRAPAPKPDGSMKLDEWVLCTIPKKHKASPKEEEESTNQVKTVQKPRRKRQKKDQVQLNHNGSQNNESQGAQVEISNVPIFEPKIQNGVFSQKTGYYGAAIPPVTGFTAMMSTDTDHLNMNDSDFQQSFISNPSYQPSMGFVSNDRVLAPEPTIANYVPNPLTDYRSHELNSLQEYSKLQDHFAVLAPEPMNPLQEPMLQYHDTVLAPEPIIANFQGNPLLDYGSHEHNDLQESMFKDHLAVLAPGRIITSYEGNPLSDYGSHEPNIVQELLATEPITPDCDNRSLEPNDFQVFAQDASINDGTSFFRATPSAFLHPSHPPAD